VLDATITAAAGFLIAVLWFDLMFDVQVARHRAEPLLSEPVLGSIAAYYRRVLTTASPMGRLVGVVMLVLLAGLVYQAADGDTPTWVSAVSIVAALTGIGLAAARVVRAAVRLGARTDSLDVQTTLARSILRDHLICLAAMIVVLAVQLAGA
jgi:hypothetical protein